MNAQILDGVKLAQQVRARLAAEIENSNDDHMPVLAVLAVGENEASKIYVRNKKKAASEIGMGCEVLELSESIGEMALLEVINELNEDPHINGIIVQQPLPPQINPQHVLAKISPAKDVDGFSPYNLGLLAVKEEDAVIAATPKGILKLIEQSGEALKGKHAVIIGRSNIVGRPLALLLLNHDYTVTVVHSKTKNIEEVTRQADVLIAACGCPRLVKGHWIKDGAVVIDVGINRDENGKLCGDVDFEAVSQKAAFVTPVPGGVGPMTVAMLLENTWEAFKKQKRGQKGCHCGHHNCCGHSS